MLDIENYCHITKIAQIVYLLNDYTEQINHDFVQFTTLFGQNNIYLLLIIGYTII